MYDFYYNELVPKMEENQLEMLYTDTDSLIIAFRSKALDVDLARINKMDFSNFHDKHRLFSRQYEAALFHMKIEMAGHKIIGFVGLKAKCYSLLIEPGDCI